MGDVGLLTSLRWDQFLLLSKQNAVYAPSSRQPCAIYLLAYHRDRILAAAQAADRSYPHLEGDSGLELLADQVQQHVADKDAPEALKVRIVIAPSGAIDLTSTNIPDTPQTSLFPQSLDSILDTRPTYRVYIAPVPCKPNFHTRYKTTDRTQYDAARSALPQGDGDDGLIGEILMVNPKGDIMEGSITTAYFNHMGTWITPAESSGGNLGVTRRWALEQRLCEEGLVSMNSVQVGSVGEKVVLSNGARGFGWGRVDHLPS